MKIGEVAQRFNLSLTTIRRATERGTLSCFTLPSGHRRFRQQDVLSWLGVEQEEVSICAGIPIAAVIRVSSDNQARPTGGADKSSLQHQEDRVRQYIEERWDSPNVIWYSSVGSGMNFDRAEFLSLVTDILDGKFRGGFIVATDLTRICRFGIRLFEFLCQRGGCKVIYTLNDGEAKSLNETLTDEILAILTHYTARASGQKNKLINEVRMDEDQLRDAYLWYKQGFSYKAIEKRFSDEGRGTNDEQLSIVVF